LAGVLSLVLFAYSYIAYGVLYAIFIAAVSLVAVLMQAYSLVGSRSNETVEEKSNEEQSTEVQFANVGRF
jgi:cell division protein FtsL